MKVFCHHLYEYRKGLRNLVLHTVPGSRRACVEKKLRAGGIDHVVYELANGNINVFFGADECVAVIRAIAKDRLGDYTAEEDFILGTMLGYGRLEQCARYIWMRTQKAREAVLPQGSRSEELDSEPAELAIAV